MTEWKKNEWMKEKNEWMNEWMIKYEWMKKLEYEWMYEWKQI